MAFGKGLEMMGVLAEFVLACPRTEDVLIACILATYSRTLHNPYTCLLLATEPVLCAIIPLRRKETSIEFCRA